MKLQERIKQYQEDKMELLKKYKLKGTINLVFPMYNELPDELKLAVIVANKHKPQFLESFEDTEGDKV